MAAAEINIGGWHEDVARIAGQAMANATPSVTAQTVPAETITVTISVETASDTLPETDQIELAPDVVTPVITESIIQMETPEVLVESEAPVETEVTAPVLPTVPVVPTVPKV